MGYYINQRGADFKIKKNNIKKALEAIKALDPENGGGGSYRDGRKFESYFAWVNTNEYKNAKTLKEAVQAFRWDIEFDKGGNCINIYFEGEKVGDDDQFLEALAPFVEPGSYIEMQGENGEIWRWVFNGETMKEVYAEVTFPE